MTICFLALHPTDALIDGFLPAAAGLGLPVVLLTDQPAAHTAAYADHPAPPSSIIGCEVGDLREVVAAISRLGELAAVFSNSDHLQTQAALAASYLGLPGKDWRATERAKNKALMRRHLAAAGLDAVACLEIGPGEDPASLRRTPDFSLITAEGGRGSARRGWVVKPREGVASEDVVLVYDAEELVARAGEIQTRRPGDWLVVEEYLDGPLHTLETIGDAYGRVRVLGGFRTHLSPAPYFIEEALDWRPALPQPVLAAVLDQLDALGVGLGACHTEFVVQGERARLVEVNYRIIGDQCDLLLADLLDEPVFEQVLLTHLGEPLPGPAFASEGASAITPTSSDASGGRAARVEYVCADRSGVLDSAPSAADVTTQGVRLTYRPLRKVGERIERTHTNRDYLGVVRVIGADQDAVDRAAKQFVADHRWDIRP